MGYATGVGGGEQGMYISWMHAGRQTTGATDGEDGEETEKQVEVVVTNRKVTKTKHITTQEGEIAVTLPPG